MQYRIYLSVMEIQILKETADFLVVNKPYGLVVNRAESIVGETVQDWIEQQRWFLDWLDKYKKSEKTSDGELFLKRSGFCHRIDKETSGCLLIAKNEKSLVHFLKLFKERKVEKEYIALVHGKVEPKMGDVVLPMKRSLLNREKWQVHYDGKRAVSNWVVQEYYRFSSDNERWKNTLTLLRIGLKTGRTHQIRVHFSFLGWPLFSDDRYLQSKQSMVDRSYLDRHFLHSCHIAFEDIVGKKWVIDSPLPVECDSFLKTLEKCDFC